MRFYEFCIDVRPMINYEFVILRRIFNEAMHTKINENSDFEQAAEEFRDFINLHQSNLYSLLAEEKYYPLVLIARPSAKNIEIEISDLPVEYLGLKDNVMFIFNGPTFTFEVPTNKEIIDDNGSLFISTTIFIDPKDRDQFLTLIYSKFAGPWTINQKKMTV